MRAVKWAVAKLQGDNIASFYREMSGREVTGRYISIPAFHGTLIPMDFWTPLRFLRGIKNKEFKKKSKERKDRAWDLLDKHWQTRMRVI